MSGKNINFYDKNKKAIKIDKTDANKVLVSKEEPYGTKNSFKYFTGCNDNDVIRPLCIKLLQTTGYAKKIHLTMSFKTSDKELLKQYDD